MQALARSLALTAAFVAAPAALAQEDLFNASVVGVDDAFSLEVLTSRSPEHTAFLATGTRPYALAVRSGASQAEGSDVVNAHVGATVAFVDLLLKPSLEARLSGRDVLSTGRVATTEIGVRAQTFAAGAFAGGASARVSTGASESYAAGAAIQWRIPAPNLNASLGANLLRAGGRTGWSASAGAGYGVPLPGARLVALTGALTTSAPAFGEDLGWSASGTLQARIVSGATVALGVSRALAQAEKPWTASGALIWSL